MIVDGTGHDRKILFFALLALLVGAAYANALWDGFAFDDTTLVLSNALLTHLNTLPKLLTSDYWVTRMDPYGEIPVSSGLYRPVVHLTFALNVALGGLNPSGFHLVNMLLHLLVTWLVFALARRFDLPLVAAGVAAAFFAVHPLHTEAVTGIVGRAELLMALGVLGGWWLALGGRYWWSLAAFAIGLASKEQAMVFPALLLLSDFCGIRPRVAGLRQLAGYVVVLAGFLILRTFILGGLSVPTPHVVDNPLGLADWLPRLLMITKVAGRYLWLCVWPASLSADYSYNSIPLPTSVWDAGVLASLCAWSGLLGLAGWSFSLGDRRPALFIGLTVVTFLPGSNLIVLIGTIMAERLFYLPSAGLCLLAGWGVAHLTAIKAGTQQLARGGGGNLRNTLVRASLMIVMLLVIGGLLMRTIVRNRDWVNDEQLFQSTLSVVPMNAKVHAALARVSKQKGTNADLQLALEHFQTALSIYPDFVRDDAEFASHLGDVLLGLGQEREGLAALEQGFRLEPYWGLYLGLAYARLGKPEKAEQVWREAIEYTPNEPELRSRLSRFLIERGQYAEGLALAEEVLRRHSDFAHARFNKALALEAMARLEEAANGYEQVLNLPSAPPPARRDAEARLVAIRARLGEGMPAGKDCMPGLTRC